MPGRSSKFGGQNRPVLLYDVGSVVRVTPVAPRGVRYMRCKHWLGSVVVALVAVLVSSTAYAGPPQITVTPPSFDYGSLRVANAATTTLSQTFTIGNNSNNQALTISTVAISGTNAADFTITADTATGATLNMGQTATVTVRFDPSAVGPRNATLVI